MHKSFYSGKKVLITGGNGFIGSALADNLIKSGAETTIVGQASKSSLNNVFRVWNNNKLKYKQESWGYQAEDGNKFIRVNLEYFQDTLNALKNQEIVFHLAANFGGRGYIENYPADCCENFAINQNIFKAAHLAGIERVHYASSACVYPIELLEDYDSEYLLKEEDAYRGNWAGSDSEYGWAKLMGEKNLLAYIKQYGLKGSIARFVNVYGPWENETHALMALIRRALAKEDPYLIWGTGRQTRDFTYIDDVIRGSMKACEIITNGEAVNFSIGKRYTIVDLVNTIFEIIRWRPKKIFFDTTKPEGSKSRALDITKARKLLDWEPEVYLKEGLERTIAWFIKEHTNSIETVVK
ncbi:MAG: NAD-dependent epimerase/dehydratase family protein [Thermodesulfovibrionia bacterium]|nr:NAD-dependent epimerase/dehydratase family protein [Thermodesulfovibrionia bacterium]